MGTLLIAVGALVGYLIAYHTYGRWLARKVFKLNPDAKVPSVELNDDRDFVPTKKAIVFGHHFTSIAGTGPIVGPAIAVMWGWLPALLWVFFGSILIGAVHDFGALVVSLRNRGQTVGDIAGRLLNPRVRIMFLCVLFMALTIVLAIFGLVIAAVFRQYPAAIFPCTVQIPIAIMIGLYLHRKGVNLLLPSLLALAVMYLTVIFGDVNFFTIGDSTELGLGALNAWMASWPTIVWVGLLLVYSYAGRLLNPRVRIMFLCVLFMALTIVLAIFGLVIAAVFRQYPAAIFPCTVQIPIAIMIGLYLHRKGVNLLLPSLLALAVMYLTVIFGDVNFFTIGDSTELGLGALNAWMASWPTIVWVGLLLVYSYVASVLPVWTLLQPRDYINSLQLLTALGLILVGLVIAAFLGGAPVGEDAVRQPLEIAAPLVRWQPEGAPMLVPFLFITIACGAISGFHCLVSSGTSSKQLKCETDAHFVGYGSMLTEGFLATLVILACVAGLGFGIPLKGALVNNDQLFHARITNVGIDSGRFGDCSVSRRCACR